MGDIHALPSAPVGWYQNKMGAWTRGDGLYADPLEDGQFRACTNVTISVGDYATLPEACHAAERAYCGAYVGEPLARSQ